MKTYLATECIKFGWETFKKRPWFLIGMTVLYFVASFFVGFIGDIISSAAQAAGGTFANNAIHGLIGFFLNGFLGLMMLTFLLKTHDDIEHVQIADAWN